MRFLLDDFVFHFYFVNKWDTTNRKITMGRMYDTS